MEGAGTPYTTLVAARSISDTRPAGACLMESCTVGMAGWLLTVGACMLSGAVKMVLGFLQYVVMVTG